jgi:hypothetical protein
MQVNTEMLTVRLSKPMLSALKQVASEDGTTVSQLARDFIAAALKDQGVQLTLTINLN